MALTNAEKQRRYREKLKNNPEKKEKVRRKNLERIKSKIKKVKDMTEDEKIANRKIWRKQKQNQKQKKVAEETIIETSDASKTQSKNPKLYLRLSKLNGRLKKSLSDIEKQNKTIQRLRKRIFRQKKQLEVDIEKRDKEILSLKCRNEVLESMIKTIYKEGNTTEKRHIKKTALDKVKTKKIISGCLGIVRVRKYKRIGQRKSDKISEEIAKFFVRDDISRITAGKKECRTRHKAKQQIRYLTDSLRNLYKTYKEEDGQQSFATFFKYKPFFVLSPTMQSRNTCLCIKHSNMSYLLNALVSKQLLARGTTLKDVLLRITCNITSFDCMHGKCPNCVNSAPEFDVNDDRKNEEVNWWCWESEKHTYTKKEKTSGEVKEMQTRKTLKKVKTGTLTELIQTFNKEIKLFKKHYFNMKTQQRQYQECLRQLKPHEVLILCDFSENFNCKLSEEIQAMHFGASKQQVTLHCVMVYWEDKCQSFCSVSDSPCHEPAAIWAHLLPVIKFITQKTPNTNVLHFYSDGPTSQYRQKKNYFMLNLFARKMNFNYATWSYTESGHGKGVADGIGGAVKRSLDRQVLYGHDIRNADDAYTNICAAMKAVKCFLIPIQEVENMKKVIPTNLRPLSGNNDVHQIITAKEENVVLHRPLSCFCGSEAGICSCYLPKRHNLLPAVKEHTSSDDDTERMTVQDVQKYTEISIPIVTVEHAPPDDDIEMMILQDLQDGSELPIITIDEGIITVQHTPPDEDTEMMTVKDLQKDMELPVPLITADDGISTVKNKPPDYFSKEVVIVLDEDEETMMNTPRCDTLNTTSLLTDDDSEMMTVQDLRKDMEFPVRIITADDGISTVENTPPDNFGNEVVIALDEDEEPMMNTLRRDTLNTTSSLNMSAKIHTGKRKTTNTAVQKKVKVIEPSSSESKEYYRSQSLKTVVTRFFYCYLCKRRNFFLKHAFNVCMICKNKVCVQCTGPTGFDYICNKCLE